MSFSGISSLELLQIVNEIMDVFGVDLTEHLGEIFTCKDLEEILYRQEASRPKEENVSSQKPLDLQAFPVKRTFMKNACFRFVMFFLKRNYRFSVVGLENLKKKPELYHLSKSSESCGWICGLGCNG